MLIAIHLVRTNLSTELNSVFGGPQVSTEINEFLGSSAPVTHTYEEMLSINESVKRNILVFGASSFIGSSICQYFHKKGHSVVPAETGDEYTLNSLQYYRWKKLSSQKLDPKFIASNNINTIFDSIEGIEEIIYIPHKIYNGVTDNRDALSYLELLIHLLEFVKHEQSVRVSLITGPEQREPSMQSSWLRTLEDSLVTYWNLYNIKISYIQLDAFHPEILETEQLNAHQEFFLCTLVKIIHFVVQSNSDGHLKISVPGNSDIKSCSLAFKIYEQLKERNVVMSTYFTSIRNPQYAITFAKNTFRFMQSWLQSAEKLGIETVIFHDNFNDGFMERITKNFKGVTFQHVKSFEGRTPNDYRFYLQYDYLQKHPEISNVILTDMRDITFLNDPFKVMEIIGNYLYVGVDVSYYLDSWSHTYPRGLIHACYLRESNKPSVTMHPFYNAGVVGGARHLMLKYLKYFTESLNTTPHGRNCNMATVTIVTHKYFSDKAFSGYPFQSAFKMDIPGPQGLAIKHKMVKKNV